MIIKFDDVNKICQVSLRAGEILNIMDQREEKEGLDSKIFWRPECGSYMIEGTPGRPYGELRINDKSSGESKVFIPHLKDVEPNMVLRRKEIKKLLLPGEQLLSLTSFPR